MRSPTDGTVQQLAVHTVGGVVPPAQQLMVIVPLDSRIEVEAMVSNRDIGFVRDGQIAAVKVDTFNFTRYGLIEGRVIGVSRDAITRETPASRQSGRADRDRGIDKSSEPAGQEMLYAARVHLDRSDIIVEAKLVDLTPGMAVTVEIKTGSRLGARSAAVFVAVSKASLVARRGSTARRRHGGSAMERRPRDSGRKPNTCAKCVPAGTAFHDVFWSKQSISAETVDYCDRPATG